MAQYMSPAEKAQAESYNKTKQYNYQKDYDEHTENIKNQSYDELYSTLNHLAGAGKKAGDAQYDATEAAIKKYTSDRPAQFDSKWEEGQLQTASQEAKDYVKSQPTYTTDTEKQKKAENTTAKKTYVPSGSDLGGLTTEQWYLKMLEQGFSPDEIADLYEKEGYKRTGAKFLAAKEKYKDWKKSDVMSMDANSTSPEEDVAKMSTEEKQSLFDKIKGSLTNKDLEKYAKDNGISYGQALSYTLASFFKGRANDYAAMTGSAKPFSDEETQSPLYQKYRVTSGKTNEVQGNAQADKNYIENKDVFKEAAEAKGTASGTGNAAETVADLKFKTENGKTFVDFENLQSTLKDISDEQKLKTLEKQLGLERESAKALQKFLSDLSVSQNYSMGLNGIQLEKDKIKVLGDYLKNNPNAIENFKQYGQEMQKANRTEAQLVNEWIQTVTNGAKAVGDVAVAAGALSDKRVKNYMKVSGGKCK